MVDRHGESMSNDLERLPSRLSPSRAKDFINCPKLFHFKAIERLPGSTSPERARGTIAHAALEKLYELPKGERTLEAALEFVAPAWEAMSTQREYSELADLPEQERQKMLDFATKMVRNYFDIEDPNRFDPVAIEYRTTATINGVVLSGMIDRLDEVVSPETENPQTYITDYKTGKLPNPRYQDEAFFAMRIYALLMHEETGKMPYALRLVFLRATGAKAVKMVLVTEDMLNRTRRDIANLWTRIKAAAARGEWPTNTGPLCNYCDFQNICPAWAGKLEKTA